MTRDKRTFYRDINGCVQYPILLNKKGMNDIIKGENLDGLLSYSLTIKDSRDIFVSDIEGEILIRFNQDEIILMLKEIQNYEYEILEIDLVHNPNFRKNGLTKSFLNNGGFTKIFNEKDVELLSIKESKEKDEKIKELQLEEFNYKKTIRNQEQRIRDLEEELKLITLIQKYWWVIGVLIGIGISIERFLL